jgi:hypothetical protein
MVAKSRLRFRRSSAQLTALAQVEREIRAVDQHSRRKYLREFSDAFLNYESILTPAELEQAVLSADVVLVGDYHALPESQRYAGKVVEQFAKAGCPVILGLETIFSRDQHILDEWQAGEIDADELRERIRFDLDWGYDWQPFYELLTKARAAGAKIIGLDCMPRGDLRRISARDRHAAEQIAEAHAENPRAVIVALFGESHLAPQHLPQLVRNKLPHQRVLTILQNVDPLYWRAAGEPSDRVEAVRVSEDVVCVFTSTPLEKYESYRMCIERWRCERPGPPDLAPTLYNLVDALLRFLNVDKYAPLSSARPRLFVDLLPEVCSRATPDALRTALQRKGASEKEIRDVLLRIEEFGCCYVRSINTIFIRQFQMLHGAEAVSEFVHSACSGALFGELHSRNRDAPAALEETTGQPQTQAGDDGFYARCIQAALAYFGSRVLYPARAAVREQDLYVLYARTREEIEDQSRFNYRDYMEMVDFIIMHKDFEMNARKYWETPPLIEQGRRYTGECLEFVTQQLGNMLGSELYDAYVSGRVHKRFIRSLFFRDLSAPGIAHGLYFGIARRTKKPTRRWVA